MPMQSNESSNKEIQTLVDFVEHVCRKAKLRHPNLASLLGYSDGGDQCLVYEYCANGNLESWLLGGKKKRPSLTWKQRLQITCGIARGLWFLHNNALERAVHGDVKLANILLTEKLEAKLSDSKINGTNIKSQAASDDVFNFGVVLLQLVSGRKAETLVVEEE